MPAPRPAVALAHIALLAAFVVSWFAPLMRAGVLPLFGLDEISVVSGLQTLWAADVFLALTVTFLAILVPALKTVGGALLNLGLMSPRLGPALSVLGKLAMADVFLVALYVVVVKGVGIATVETAWGLYFFTGCVLAGIALSLVPARAG